MWFCTGNDFKQMRNDTNLNLRMLIIRLSIPSDRLLQLPSSLHACGTKGMHSSEHPICTCTCIIFVRHSASTIPLPSPSCLALLTPFQRSQTSAAPSHSLMRIQNFSFMHFTDFTTLSPLAKSTRTKRAQPGRRPKKQLHFRASLVPHTRTTRKCK